MTTQSSPVRYRCTLLEDRPRWLAILWASCASGRTRLFLELAIGFSQIRPANSVSTIVGATLSVARRNTMLQQGTATYSIGARSLPGRTATPTSAKRSIIKRRSERRGLRQTTGSPTRPHARTLRVRRVSAGLTCHTPWVNLGWIVGDGWVGLTLATSQRWAFILGRGGSRA